LTKDERKGSLAPKAVECRFIGFDDQDIKIIYVPSKHMILRRRDCIFDESNEFTESPAFHEENLLRRYPQLRKGASEFEGKTISDKMDFFEDELYFEPETEEDEWNYLQSEPKINSDEPITTAESQENYGEAESVIDTDHLTLDRMDTVDDVEAPIHTNHHCSLMITFHIEVVNHTALKSSTKDLRLPPVPKNLEGALASPDRDKWIEAINAEINQLVERGTFEYAGHEGPGAKSKLILDVKFDNEMKVKYKARLVLCGYSQIYGLDYDQTHAPTISKSSVLIVFVVSLYHRWKRKADDVGNAFLEGKNDFQIFMYWPQALLPPGHPPVRVEVINSLYGEKQAARIWNDTLDKIFVEGMNLTRLASDPCVYKFVVDGEIKLILTVHVDDIIVTGETEIIDAFNSEFQQHVKKLTVYDNFTKYLGLHLTMDSSSSTFYTVSQRDYIDEIIAEFMPDWDPTTEDDTDYPSPIQPKHIKVILDLMKQLPEASIFESDDIHAAQDHFQSADYAANYSKTKGNDINFLPLIGKLRHLIDSTRPDLLATVSILSSCQYQHPEDVDLDIWINLLKYIYYSRDDAVLHVGYKKDMPKITLFGFSDASYVVDGDSKSRLGGCFYISNDCGAVSSYSKKDTTVSHSSTEAELKAIDLACRQIEHLRLLLDELGHTQEQPTHLYVDNRSAIALSESFKTVHLVRHINMRINYIRECINKRVVELHFVPTVFNVADILTKLLHPTTYIRLQKMLLQGFDNTTMEQLYYTRTLSIHNQTISDDNIIIESFDNNSL
jgi:hypothetical protein